jgi:hypothetical protein
MKKVLLVLMAAFFSMAMVSCSKSNEDLIIGTWQETEVTYTEYNDGQQIRTESMLEEGDIVKMTFKDDHTYSLTYVSEYDESDDNGTWSIDGDKLTIVDDDYAMVYTIDKLNKKECNITYSEEMDSTKMTIVIKMKRL